MGVGEETYALWEKSSRLYDENGEVAKTFDGGTANDTTAEQQTQQHDFKPTNVVIQRTVLSMHRHRLTNEHQRTTEQ